MTKRKKSSNPFSLLSFQDIIMSVSGIFIFLTLLLALDLVSRVIGSAQVENVTVKTKESMDEIKNEVDMLKKQINQANQTIDSSLKIQKDFLDFSKEDFKKEVESVLEQKNELTTEVEKLKTEKIELEQQQSQITEVKKTIAEIEKKIEKTEQENIGLDSKIESLENMSANVFVRSGNHRETPWLVDLAQDKIAVFSLKEDISKHFSSPDDFIRWTKGHDPRHEYFMLYVRPSSASFYEEIRNSLKKSGFKTGLDLMPEDEKIIITTGGSP